MRYRSGSYLIVIPKHPRECFTIPSSLYLAFGGGNLPAGNLPAGTFGAGLAIGFGGGGGGGSSAWFSPNRSLRKFSVCKTEKLTLANTSSPTNKGLYTIGISQSANSWSSVVPMVLVVRDLVKKLLLSSHASSVLSER